jgi:hypothetical protein
MKKCHCQNGDYVEHCYVLGGLEFDDSYCGICSLPWRRPKPATSQAPVAVRLRKDGEGTSTNDDEAPLREIGRAAFGITYPEDRK